MGPGSWVMQPRGLLSLHGVPFARCGRAVTAEQRFVATGNSQACPRFGERFRALKIDTWRFPSG